MLVIRDFVRRNLLIDPVEGRVQDDLLLCHAIFSCRYARTSTHRRNSLLGITSICRLVPLWMKDTPLSTSFKTLSADSLSCISTERAEDSAVGLVC